MLRSQQMLLGSGANHPISSSSYSDTGPGWSLFGGSIAGNGTMYATIPNNGDFALGTDNFCIEWWQWLDPNSRSNGRVWQIGSWPSAPLGVSVEGSASSRNFYFWINGSIILNVGFTSPQMKTFHSRWHHFCIERVSGATTVYFDGQNLHTIYDSYNITEGTQPINLLSEAGGVNPMAGYIADFHIVKNNFKYNGVFTPSITPITPITGSVCLLNARTNDTAVADSSPVNKTINNVNAYWSHRGPYLAPVFWVDGSADSYPGSGSTWNNLGRDDASVTLQNSMGTDAITTTAYQNNGTGHGTDSTGFFYQAFSGGDLGQVQPGWYVTGHPDWIVNAVNSGAETITITGGMFVDGDTYSFTSPLAMFFNVAGHFGGANNAWAYVTAGTHPFLKSLPNGITVVAVYDMVSNTNGWERVIDFGNNAGSKNIILNRASGTDDLEFSIFDSSNTKRYTQVVNGVTPGLKIAVATDDVNGEHLSVVGLTPSNTTGWAIPDGPRSNMWIGRSNWNYDAFLHGKIYHLSIFDRALTTEEIANVQMALKEKYSPDTVTLKLNLDVANTSSYDVVNTPAVWTDTVSNTAFTLYNSPTYSADNGGYLSFAPGSGQYADTTTSLNALSTWTVELWHYYDGTNSGGAPCILSEKFTGTYINYAIGTLDQGTIQAGYYNGWHTTSPYTLTAGNWYHIVGVYDSTDVKLYINGVLVRHTLSNTTPSLHGGAGINLMRRWDNAEFWGGRLAVVRIYDGALGQSGITYNFNSSKARFGL